MHRASLFTEIRVLAMYIIASRAEKMSIGVLAG